MKKTLIFAAVLALLASCATTKQVAYFQDSEDVTPAVAAKPSIKIQPGDEISIIVNCPTARVSSQFNLPMVSKRLGQDTDDATSSGNQTSGYTVGGDGCIDFPVLGRIPVAGKTREQIAAMIKDELIVRQQVTEVVVTVDFVNLSFQVLGEVNHPGRFAITKEGVTITEALAAAGDLTITGKRQNVKVLRNVNGKQQTFVLDITSKENVLASPAYYLQQNDLVYVEPNNMRKRQATVNGNNLVSATFWMSLASIATSAVILSITFAK